MKRLIGKCWAADYVRALQLWRAALLDRPGVPNHAEPAHLLVAGLIKLRDLPDNFWNADTLFLLTPTVREAHQLKQLAEDEDWAADEVHVYENREETDRALGLGRRVRTHGRF